MKLAKEEQKNAELSSQRATCEGQMQRIKR